MIHDLKEFGARLGRAAYVIIVLMLVLAGIVFSRNASARDIGQRKDADEHISQWFRALRQPDNPSLSCCGKADGYHADKVETGPNGELIAVITDERPDEPLGRRHVPPGTRIVVPKNKIKWDQGNPTGHIIIFLSTNNDVFCYVQAGGV